MCEQKNSSNVTCKKKVDGNLFIKCAGNNCPTVLEEGQERTPCLRSTCITVTSCLLIPAGNFHVSVLRFNNWADIRKPWDFSRCYWQGQRSTIPFHQCLCSEGCVSLRCTVTVPATWASHPPHQAPPFTLISTQKEIGHTILKVNLKVRPSVPTHSQSLITITNRAQEWNNILSSSSWLQRQEFRALFPWQQKRASQQPPR